MAVTFSGISKINGVAYIEQGKYSCTRNKQSTAESGVDSLGNMRNVFLRDRRKIIIGFPQQSKADRAAALGPIAAIVNKSNISLEFLDPETGGYTTSTFMIGSEYENKLIFMGNEDRVGWDEIEIHFIEN